MGKCKSQRESSLRSASLHLPPSDSRTPMPSINSHQRGPLRVAMIGLRGIPASYGGVERAVEELSAHLADRGHEITVYARSAYSDPDVTEHRGVDIVRLPQVNTKHAEAVTHSVLSVAHALWSRK